MNRTASPRIPPQPGPAVGPTRRAGLLGACLALGLGLVGCAPEVAASDRVSLEVARAELEAGRAVLIDIREPQEHAGGIAPGARLLPMRQLAQRLSEVPKDPDRPVLLICHTQNRSSATMQMLKERGYTHVRYVEGGMSGWMQRGWPLVKPGS